MRAAARGQRLVLAVSGGRDSMALLFAAARVARPSIAVVATFDHGTGVAATRACALVAREAARLGLPVVIGHARRRAASEAQWREMRMAFLNDVAHLVDGVVATAHTRDDQVETVLIRILRGSGARGIAGLYSGGDFLRPLLGVSRDDVAAYAREIGAPWVDDPSNASSKHLRNRVRRDLLPAIERVRPGFSEDVLSLARQAADVRANLDRLVAATMKVETRRGGIAVPSAAVAKMTPDELAVLWPVLASRAGARTDRRGADRAVKFTKAGRVGSRIQLSGGWELARTKADFELRRTESLTTAAAELANGLVFDRWTFRSGAGHGAWTASLPARPLTVRRWEPGDRMDAGTGPRRVKRFLRDAHVSGLLRERWPVVLSGNEIVWIPGIRRGVRATERPGRRGLTFNCELNDR